MELIERLFDDTLWMYTAIAGSIFGALFIYWIKDTFIAFWAINKWQDALDFLVNRWGWSWFKHNPDAWKAANPKLTKKIEDLEQSKEMLSNRLVALKKSID
jgi:hypothetical protein